MHSKSRRGDMLGIALILSVCVSLFGLTQITHSADGATWSSIGEVRIERTGDVTIDAFNTTRTIPCSDQEFTWKGRAGGWFNPIVTTKYTRCAVEMADAYFENGSSMPGRIRSFSSDKTFGLELPNVSNPTIFPVPNSHSLVMNSWSYQNYYGGTSGLHIVKDYRLTFTDSRFDSEDNKFVRPGKPYDFELRGPDGKLIPIRTNGLKFSPNGEWMIFQLHYGGKWAWARLNLETYEVKAFAKPVQEHYGVYDAISNDGRYVAMYEPLQSVRVYDLERCASASQQFLSQQCSFVELYDTLKKHFGAWDMRLRNLAFKGERTLSFFAGTIKTNTWNYGEYTLRYGEQPTSNGYLAMGDSFSSGEGAYDYRSETDFHVDDTLHNRCHQSRSSYPYILNKTIGFDWFGSVACSGAEREHVLDTPQAKGIASGRAIYDNFLPGYVGQNNFLDLENSPLPHTTTITITGNDIGFADILSACVHPLSHQETCYSDRRKLEKLANLIDSQIKPLTQLLEAIKSRNDQTDFRLYMIGYPKIFSADGICGWNADMNEEELKFADTLTNYLNKAIEYAAANAGVRYVDVAETFVNKEGRDYRLCGNQENLAVNGLVLRGRTSKKPENPYYQESFHPNLLGHALLARAINQKTSSLSQPMPEKKTPVYQVDSSLRIDLVGDNERLVEKSNDSYEFSTAPGFITRGDSLDFSGKNIKADAKTGSRVIFELHSTPIKLGEGVVGGDGSILGSAAIPTDVEPGYHEIHILYRNFFDELVDRYRIVFVRASDDDYDGDGILNQNDPCITSDQSEQDIDNDSIDDACDDEYKESLPSNQATIPTQEQEAKDITESIALLGVQPRPVIHDEGVTMTGDAVREENIDGEVLHDSASPVSTSPKADAGTMPIKGNIVGLPNWPIVISVLAVVSIAFLVVSKALAKRRG